MLPHAPELVEGVTNLRGKVLPVINLRKRFGLAAHQMDKNNRIILVSTNRIEVGMTVDEVSQVVTVPEGAIEPTPTIATKVNSAFMTGIAKLELHHRPTHLDSQNQKVVFLS